MQRKNICYETLHQINIKNFSVTIIRLNHTFKHISCLKMRFTMITQMCKFLNKPKLFKLLT